MSDKPGEITFSFSNFISSSLLSLTFLTNILFKAFDCSLLSIQSFKKTKSPISTSSFAAI